MLKLDSKEGMVNGSQEAVYNYISDFKNFAHLLPSEQLQHIEVTGDVLRFGVSGLGIVGLKIAGKQPYTQLVIKAMDDSVADFTIWISIGEVSENTSSVNLTLQANLNMFLEMMAKAPLQQILNLIVDKLTSLEFRKQV